MTDARKILKDYGYLPKKRRGQNFLFREETLQAIAYAANIQPGETVVEIGPGPGNLTRHLVKAAGQVIVIELDHELATILKAELKAENLSVIEADALDIDFASLNPAGGKLKVVANLPYNITTPILFKLLETPEIFSELLLLLQREVAERIAAKPGGKTYGILSAQTQLLADCWIALSVGPEAFTPKPKVNSALIRVKMLSAPRAEVKDIPTYRKLVRASFAHRRKTLANADVKTSLGLDKAQWTAALVEAGIDPGRRAETVAVAEFAALANILSSGGGNRA